MIWALTVVVAALAFVVAVTLSAVRYQRRLIIGLETDMAHLRDLYARLKTDVERRPKGFTTETIDWNSE